MEGHHPWHVLLRWFSSYADPELRGVADISESDEPRTKRCDMSSDD